MLSPAASTSLSLMVTVVIGTAVVTLLIAVIYFWLYRKLVKSRKGRSTKMSFRRGDVETDNNLGKLGKSVRGLIVEEGGTDVLYLRRPKDVHPRSCFPKAILNPSYCIHDLEEEKRVDVQRDGKKSNDLESQSMSEHHYNPSSAKMIISDQHPSASSSSASTKQTPKATPPPPPPPKQPTRLDPPPHPKPPPPPPPRLPQKPVRLVKKAIPPSANSPPPSSTLSIAVSSTKPPTGPKGSANRTRMSYSPDEGSSGDCKSRVKLKPLHWDKVTANVDHSIVWNEINDGSLRFDDELMETLFAYKNGKLQSLQEAKSKTPSTSSRFSSILPTKIFILDPRKSQNTAIVLKSLDVSRKEIVDALHNGNGLSSDVLEKLNEIAPSKEEVVRIIRFDGNPSRLADAEYFLYHILKAVPSAFVQLNALLFRENYDSDIRQLKDSLQSLKLGCRELRTQGLFFKLLEAILKAGNRMNAGTARGNAQAFDLNALRKLSDVKSTDGKTTLLHFIVEQVIHSEGRRCLIKNSRSFDGSNGQGSSQETIPHQENDREYLNLGLQELEKLNHDLSNVRKAATINCEGLLSMYTMLSSRVAGIQQLLVSSDHDEQHGFTKEMKEFLEDCNEDLRLVGEEQARVMELVDRTTDYYLVGASKDKAMQPLQLFILVNDFLAMVNRVRIDINQKLQKKSSPGIAGLSSPTTPTSRGPLKFLNFPCHFASELPRSPSSSGSDSDFQ